MPKLKAQLHIHTKEDPADHLKYTAKQIIDHAAGLGYEILSITCHNVLIFNEDLKKYAEKRRIHLIPGIEKTIDHKHVIILNATVSSQKIHTWDDLKTYKEKHPDCFVMAAHPFYPFYNYGKKLEENIGLFDAIEYSWYHSKKINKYNKKAVETAEKHRLPLIGTSDNHLPRYFDSTYSIIETPKKETDAIFQAIRSGKISFVSHDLSLWQLTVVWIRYMLNILTKKALLK